jgi:hypothetical protein
MKKFLFISLMSGISYIVSAQTATSVANGNWLNPMTWDCFCIPLPGYSISINHQVTLDTDFMFTTGDIVINSGGSLFQDMQNRNIWVAGSGYLSNSGTLNIKNLLYEGTNGSLMNAGMLTTGNLHLSTGFDNIGEAVADSLMNNSSINNYGNIQATAFTNTHNFVNSGTSNFSDFLNNGFFQNELGIIEVNNNLWNQGTILNGSASKILIGNSLLNSNPFSFDARIVNNAYIYISNSFYNHDTISGGASGYIQVVDTSFNSGYFFGTFDFCDLTPPAAAPFVDINTGVIEAGITWCAQQSVKMYGAKEMKLFPNPVSDILHFKIESFSEGTISIYNSFGEKVLHQSISIPYGTLDLTHFSGGIYFFVAEDLAGQRAKTVSFVK